MNAGFSRQPQEGIAFEPHDGSGGKCRIDCIEHHEPPHARDARKQRETLRTAVNQFDAARYARIDLQRFSLQYFDGSDTGSIVAMNQVAQA